MRKFWENLKNRFKRVTVEEAIAESTMVTLRKTEKSKPRIPPRKDVYYSKEDMLNTKSEAMTARNIQRKVGDDIIWAPKDATVAMDSLNRIPIKGTFEQGYAGYSLAQMDWFTAQGFIGYQLCAIVSQHWLVAKCCALPGEDAVRNGYEITVKDGNTVDTKVLDRIKELDAKFELNDHLKRFSKFNRIFGIRIAYFNFDVPNPRDFYSKPFNLDSIKPKMYKGIVQIDPYWMTPELDLQSSANPAALDFYNPTWWRVGDVRFHRSHLVIIRGDEVADLLKPTYYYGGISLTQKIYERVYAAERCANEAPQLLLTKRTKVRHMDLEAALADQGAFEYKLNIQTQMQDNFAVLVAGEEETVEQFDTALADVDVVIMTQYQLVAAISGIPAVKLLSTTPKGFNATGEFEEKSYHELLETVQTHELTPLVDRHHEILIRSHIMPEFSLPSDFKTTVAWNKLDSQTEKEKAETNKTKADTMGVLIDKGVIDGEDARKTLIEDIDSGYNGLDPDKTIEMPNDDFDNLGPDNGEETKGNDPAELDI